jgi:amino acid transporter
MAAPLPSKGLVRAVGLPGLVAISVNGIVGAGIFVMPATAAALLGPASPIAYVIASVAAMLTALSFAEAGGMFDRAGGPYLYAREAFGPLTGFLMGWMFLLARLAAVGAVANAFAAYLGYLHPAFADAWGRTAAIACSITVIGALNYIGVRYGSWVVNLLTVGKLVPLLIFIAAGLALVGFENFTFTQLPPFEPLRKASLILLFATGGYEFASVPTEEVIDSRRNLPVALILGLAFAAVLYLLIQIVCLGALPGLAASPAPLAGAAQVFLGPSGALLMTVGAVLSTTGTNSTMLLVGPRMLYALAQGGQLPALFAKVHPRYRTPHLSVVLFTGATLAVAVSGTFAQLAELTAIARLLYSISTCAAIPVLRRRYPAAPRTFRLPGGAVIPALGVAVSLFLLTGMTGKQMLIGGAGVFSGLILYGMARLGGNRSETAAT